MPNIAQQFCVCILRLSFSEILFFFSTWLSRIRRHLKSVVVALSRFVCVCACFDHSNCKHNNKYVRWIFYTRRKKLQNARCLKIMTLQALRVCFWSMSIIWLFHRTHRTHRKHTQEKMQKEQLGHREQSNWRTEFNRVQLWFIQYWSGSFFFFLSGSC